MIDIEILISNILYFLYSSQLSPVSFLPDPPSPKPEYKSHEDRDFFLTILFSALTSSS